MASTPPIPSVGAISEVSSQFNLAKDFGWQSFRQAFSLVDRLAEFQPQEVAFDTSFTVPNALLTGFARPDRPDSPPDIDFDVEIPDIPPFSSITLPTFGTAPEFTKDAPPLDFSGRPRPFAKTPPEIPELFPVTIPGSPDIELPPLPTFEELNLPPPPEITEHQFTATRPDFTTPVPDNGLDYTFTPYSSELLAQVQSEVARLMDQGGLGLPPAIEQAIYDRARDREDGAALQALDEIDSEFASRGFTLPSGIQSKRRAEVHQRNQENRNRLNSDLTINAAEVHIDTLRFAIQQGIAAENLTSQIYLESEQLKLSAASTVAELVLRVFSAQVDIYNAEVQAYQIDAQVFRQLIEAELTKVEVFRAELESERVRGEINQQRLDLYVAQLQGLNTLVAIYTSEVEGANAVANTNNAIIQGFAAEVDAFRSEVQAKQSEFGAWAEQIRGELGKIEGYSAETRAFAARTQAYATGVDAEAIKPRLQLEQQGLEVEQFNAQLNAVQAKIAALSQKARAIADIFSSEAAIYNAEGQISVAEAETNTRQYLAAVEEARIRSEASLAEAELLVQKTLGQDNQIVETLRGAAQAISQLAAASFSAVNASAQISEAGRASNSWSERWNFNKDVT